MHGAKRVALAVALALVWPASASAATITVTNNNDSGPGSLRQAIASAAAGDTIVVPADTYTLTSAGLTITKSLTIQGAGATSTFIDGSGLYRVFDSTGAPNGSDIMISGVTIRDGSVTGSPADGGGIANMYANLTLSHDIINGNSAVADGAGTGGAGGIAGGGGVWSKYGTLTLVDTEVSANVATANGNSAQNGGTVQGGGIEALGPLVIEGSAFVANVANALGGAGSGAGGNAFGGGLYATGGVIATTTFTGNMIDTSGAGGGAGGIGQGGGLFDTTGGTASLVNVTITTNVDRTATDGTAYGGGLYYGSGGAQAALTNATVSGNESLGSTTGGNQAGNAYLFNVGVQNTIVNAGVGDPGAQNCAGTPTSLGHNLDSLKQCSFNASGDLVNTNPLLGPLQDNGGPVPTMALQPGSPAIDAGSDAPCPSTDARGVLRPAGKACDIGAYEVPTPAATTNPATATALNGVASNPDLLGATAYFQYGSTTAYGLSTPAQAVPATTTGDAITAPLPTDTPGVYHFRLVVVNSVGMATGADRTLTIAPVLSGLKVRRRRRTERITYFDTGAGTTTFFFERRAHHRWVRVGRPFHHDGKAGTNSFRSRRKLKPGTYRLVAIPSSSGVTGQEVLVRFRIRSPSRH